MARAGVEMRERILSGAAQASDPFELFTGLSERLRRAVPFDAAVWRTTDPGTGLMTAPILAENLDDEGCSVYWDSELLDDGVMPFQELMQAARPVASLVDTTGDEPDHSSLYRRHMRPRGLGDELRAVLRVGDRPWGTISLFREIGRTPFDRADLDFVARLSTPLADRLRRFAEPATATAAVPGPGLLLFDAEGSLISANDEALMHLADMPPGPATSTPLGIAVPAWIRSTAVHAHTLERADGRGSARIRMRTTTGHWLVCHASCMRRADGEIGHIAVVVEPAAASEVARLVMAAYGLSERELEITQAVTRGLPTSEIAKTLYLSPHTVRDHVKAVFEKTGATSRGELVARLFSELHLPLGGSAEL